jgi:hypothetical protein
LRRVLVILALSGVLAHVVRAQPAVMPLAEEPVLPVRKPALVYSVDAGVGESDNVTLAPADQVSQTIAIVDADFTVQERSRLLAVSATGDFSYLDYLQNAYGSQLIGRFDGIADLDLVPERLTWVFRDDFGQQTLDPYTPVTPNNLENVNYFNTGPDLTLREGVNFLVASARYARAQYSTSPFNSNRALGSITLGRDVSAAAAISLQAEEERVLFDNTLVNTDFNHASAFGRYQLNGFRTNLEVDLGVTRISGSGSGTAAGGTPSPPGTPYPASAAGAYSSTSPITGPMAKLRLSRKLSAAATVTFSAGRELTDASSSFGTLQNGGALVGPVNPVNGAQTNAAPPAVGGVMNGIMGAAPPALTSSSYTSNYASGNWQYSRLRTKVTLAASWEKDLYPGQPLLDVVRPSASATVQRRLTTGLTLELIGRWDKSDYINAALANPAGSADFEDWVAGGALVWRDRRGLEIRLRADHDARSADGGNGYAENRVFLTVGYNSQPTREQAD